MGAYSDARDEMLRHTNSEDAPWTVIDANDKKLAHLNLIRDLLSRVKYAGKERELLTLDPHIAFTWPTHSKNLPKFAA
ncbi:hypothetical protein TUM22923_07120 [Polynucleobacter sp. TUM22923]|nr:hypothetical protein TUM22923_07120 [Polynucleobacter sp. TUM22923]